MHAHPKPARGAHGVVVEVEHGRWTALLRRVEVFTERLVDLLLVILVLFARSRLNAEHMQRILQLVLRLGEPPRQPPILTLELLHLSLKTLI